jgi:hypothetical protein
VGHDSGGTTRADSAIPPSPDPSKVAGCTIFPPDNPWNRDVSSDPIDQAAMTTIMPNMHPGTSLHPDWGSFTEQYGIPITTGTGATPVPMTWTTSYGKTESDPLACPGGGGTFCYPIPFTAKIEGGPSAATSSDRHVLFLDTQGAPSHCTLYELYNAQNPPSSPSGWTASNGAIFHLDSNNLRTDGWTSADAAGLPILPGLVRADEVKAGAINHALRFTMNNTYNGYIHPATHAAGLSSSAMPPMGMRMRMKASVDSSRFSGPALVIVTAMKKYGLLLADNGSNWYISGETNDFWTSDVMGTLVPQLGLVHGGDFEIVQSGPTLTTGL